jgi:hypothetical protein
MDYVGERFENETHPTDGNTYKDCTFYNCLLKYSGGELPSFDKTIMHSSRWVLEGASMNTLYLLKFLWGQGAEGRNAAMACIQFVIGRNLTKNELSSLVK